MDINRKYKILTKLASPPAFLKHIAKGLVKRRRGAAPLAKDGDPHDTFSVGELIESMADSPLGIKHGTNAQRGGLTTSPQSQLARYLYGKMTSNRPTKGPGQSVIPRRDPSTMERALNRERRRSLDRQNEAPAPNTWADVGPFTTYPSYLEGARQFLREPKLVRETLAASKERGQAARSLGLGHKKIPSGSRTSKEGYTPPGGKLTPWKIFNRPIVPRPTENSALKFLRTAAEGSRAKWTNTMDVLGRSKVFKSSPIVQNYYGAKLSRDPHLFSPQYRHPAPIAIQAQRSRLSGAMDNRIARSKERVAAAAQVHPGVLRYPLGIPSNSMAPLRGQYYRSKAAPWRYGAPKWRQEEAIRESALLQRRKVDEGDFIENLKRTFKQKPHGKRKVETPARDHLKGYDPNDPSTWYTPER